MILCILPATHDLSNNEAIMLAKEFDPSGARTLGVITKPDRFENYQNQKDGLVSLLTSNSISLGKGYVVVCVHVSGHCI